MLNARKASPIAGGTAAKIHSSPVSAVVMDLDNTLWDWVAIWHAAFRAQFDKLVELSGLPEAVLKKEIRAVHQQHETSEYAFLIQELPSLQAKHPGQNLIEVYGSAIDAYRKARREILHLYPGVRETLLELRKQGCLLVGYTESQAFYTCYRIRRLELDGLLAYIYSPEDHALPGGLARNQIRSYPADTYELKQTLHRHTPRGELKPNPDILRSILRDVGARIPEAIYVGDSLMKDVAMAQRAGITDVYASYGNTRDGEGYQLLREVTHWTDADVEREKQIHVQTAVSPTYVLQSGFGEMLDLFTFVPHRG